MPLAGHQLSIGNALALCYAKGFTGGQRLITAVAVMSAESARYTKAYYVNTDGSTDRGLFQINDRAHPALSDEEAYDARMNVRYAHKLYSEQSWRPWMAYTSGRYLLFVPKVTAIWLLGAWRGKVGKWS